MWVRNELCPECGKEHLGVYDDGPYSRQCYSAGCGYVVKRDGSEGEEDEYMSDVTSGDSHATRSNKPITPLFEGGVYRSIRSRRLSKKTCERFGIKCVSSYKFKTIKKGEWVENDAKSFIFERFDVNGSLAHQKIRSIDKQHWSQRGDTNLPALFGQHTFTPTDMFPIYVTEGEFDAAAIFEATGYAAVSICHGSGGSLKDILANLEWLSKWAYIVLVFDQDDEGKKAVEMCLDGLEKGTVRVCKLPLKDANEMLKDRRGDQIKKCLWNAQEVRPSYIVSAVELLPKILVQPVMGANWPWRTMTDITYGVMPGNLIVVAGGTGVGKTEFAKDILSHAVEEQNMIVGLFSGEQEAPSTFQRIIGSKMGLKLHLPGTTWDTDAIRRYAEELDQKLFVYDKDGVFDLEDIICSIKYLARAKKAKLVVIDNLKSLEAAFTDKMNDTGDALARLKGCANELGITIILMAHLNKDLNTKSKDTKERSWRNGRVPVLENIYGTSAIEAWVDLAFGLSRNCNADPSDEMKNILMVEALKVRLDGSKAGIKFYLALNQTKGILEETI